MTIVSAHRTPKRLLEYAEGALDRGLKAIIPGAAGAGHLPGMVAAITPLPVIGVPVETGTLSGIDSLLSIVQMPKGVPVATVAINSARNAGLLALRMLGLTLPPPLKSLADFMEEQESVVIEKAGVMERGGVA